MSSRTGWGWSFVSSLMLAVAGSGHALEVKASKVLLFEKGPRYSSLTDEGKQWKGKRLVPVSATRFLALAEYDRYRLERWYDEEAVRREAQEGAVCSRKQEIIEQGWLLAVVS